MILQPTTHTDSQLFGYWREVICAGSYFFLEVVYMEPCRKTEKAPLQALIFPCLVRMVIQIRYSSAWISGTLAVGLSLEFLIEQYFGRPDA